MQLILLQDVENVGLRGDVVDVARGYARNFLLPRRLAEEATPARLAELEKRESHRARHEAATTDQASEIQKVLEQAELRFEMKAGPTGSLFGSVTATDIADELWEKHKVRVDRRKIELPQPIKRVGRYAVPVGIFEDVQAEVATLVVGVLPDGSELPPERVAEEEPTAEAEQPAEELLEEQVEEQAEEQAEEPVEEVLDEPVESAAEVTENSLRAETQGVSRLGFSRLIHSACGGLWNIARTFRVERPFRPPCRPDSRRQLRERMFCSACKCRPQSRAGRRGLRRFPPVETRRGRGVNTTWLR